MLLYARKKEIHLLLIFQLKADSEYPDWLWSLNIDRIIPLEELDPNTKQYWRRLRKMALRRNNQLAKLKKFK